MVITENGSQKNYNIMNIGILHLTDLHIKSKNDFIFNRIDKIIDAVKSDIIDLERVFLVITGDIIDKGIQENYKSAKDFLEALKLKLENINTNLSIKYILVPGNHDCNFNYDNQLRKNSLKTISYDTIGNDNSVIDICLTVQDDFWDFHNELNDSPNNKLFYQIYDEWENNSICFNCLNTAWMSQKFETNNLFFPVKKFNNQHELKKGKINISVLHHPIFWFTPNGEQNNRKELENFLGDISSIILCGHEHEEEHKKSKELWSNRETLYFSGKILQDNDSSNSGFQLLLIDIANNIGRLKQFNWEIDIYSPKTSNEFQLNGDGFEYKSFRHKNDFLEELNVLKLPISIENNPNVKLSDLYVFPDLEKIEVNNNDIDSFYDSEKLITETSFSTCIIEGENQSGKTSLLFMLYGKFIEAEKYPLFMDCKLFKSSDIDKVLKNAFKQQYDGTDYDFEKYLQYDKSHKTALLDNLQDLNLNTKTIKKIIKDLENRFGKVIITTNSLYGLISPIEVEFKDLVVFNLKPLGYKKRTQLIENYHKLSTSDSTITEKYLLDKTRQSFMQVQTVLGDRLMPPYPVFVLSILQTIVYAKPINYEQTSYGYCYHSLIHIALSKKANVENEYIDTFFNFLSEFAFYLYKSNQNVFSESLLEQFFVDYKKEYHVSFSFDRLKNALLNSMLITIQDDEWKFLYEYIYYFLVARKLADIIGKEEGKSEIKYLCENLHIEKNAKILIFIAHHTKDDFLIDEATFTAMAPFENIEPITLELDDNFFSMIKDIVKKISSDIIESTSDPIETRNKMLESEDQREREREKNKKETHEINDDEGFRKFMMPFFQAFRALEIVGQIIKNRKGSIPTNQLISMIVELYNTAFRTISFFGKTLSETKESLIESLSNRIDDTDTRKQVEDKVNDFFQLVSLQICLGVFGKVIHSVGQKDLKDLFIDAAQKINTPAADIVTFSINSYYGNLSKGELQKIVKKYEKNSVAMQIIKARVKSYLYQNYVDYKKRQSFASILNMKIGPQRRYSIS